MKPYERLERHIANYYGVKKFTAKADDWEVFLSIQCQSITQARRIEKHIKRMKSRKYIRNLKIYPEIIDKLKAQYISG